MNPPQRALGPPTEAASKESVMGKRSTISTTDAEAASLTVSESNHETSFAKHQSWPMIKPVLLAALVCAAPVCLSSAQDAKVSVDMMGIGGMSCAHWQSTQALRLEGTIWIYGFWTGLNYVAAASGQTEAKVNTAAVLVEVKKTCAQRPSQVLASAVWTAYLTSIRGRCAPCQKGEKRPGDVTNAAIIGKQYRPRTILGRSVLVL
jgi:hypothetical protein